MLFNIIKGILTLTGLIISLVLLAQVAPPAAYPQNTKISYVRTWNATAPEKDAGWLTLRPLKNVKQTTQYFDGTGRLIQTVAKQGSLVTQPNAKAVDFVSSIEYDQFGRETYKYLPFAANTIGGNTSVDDGLFKLNPFH